MPEVYLLPGKDRPVRQRHPWVFSGAIARTEGRPEPGDLVEVFAADGAWLARGYHNARSQIVVRVSTWDPNEGVDELFWRTRLRIAGDERQSLVSAQDSDAWRVVFAESDGLPGLIVDRYADWLCVQFLTAGVEVRRELILRLLAEIHRPRGIIDRSDVPVRRQEGLELRSGVVYGEPPPDHLTIAESGHVFPVDLVHGQKTGFYLDQRQNRRIIAGMSRGLGVLNAFSYTGAFAVYALAGGAKHVTNVDSSYDALEQCEAALRVNGFDPDEQTDNIAGDAFQVLRGMVDEGLRFDMVILDPPRFASRKAEVDSAARGYKDINLLALRLLRPGGLLATFSCSGLVSPDLFQKILFGAALDAGRAVQVLARFSQGPDHPVLLSFPESGYLKGLLCRTVPVTLRS